eukprot:6443670-Pyramimonas_sp.AAC.1
MGQTFGLGFERVCATGCTFLTTFKLVTFLSGENAGAPRSARVWPRVSADVTQFLGRAPVI